MEIPEDTTPFCNDLFSRTQFCHQLVQSNLEKANEIHAKIEDMPELFGVGEFVWLFNPGRYSGEHPTFKTLWESPFEVLAKKKPCTFQNTRSGKTNQYSNSLCSQTQTLFQITSCWGKMCRIPTFPAKMNCIRRRQWQYCS